MSEIAAVIGDREFSASEHRLRLRQSLVGCVLTLVLVPAGVGLDYFIYPDQMYAIGLIRLACELAVAGLMALHFTQWGRRHLKTISFAWVLAPSVTISWMIAITEGPTSPYYAGLMITIAGVCTLFPWRLSEAIAFCSTTIATYLAACLVAPSIAPVSGSGNVLLSNLMFLGMVSAICAASCHFSHHRRYEEFLLRRELDERRREIEDSYRQLEEMDRLKSQFFANISHELRTPLTLIIGPLEGLLSGSAQIPDRVAEPVGIARANALRLLKLINDLLESARLDSGARTINPERIELSEFCAAQVESLSYLAEAKDVQLGCSPADGPLSIEADPSALEKIVLNLLSNALKFTPAGGSIGLSISRVDTRAEIRIMDTGIGIPGDELPRIFDRFRQVDGSSSRKYQGAGIGLSLASELAAEMGGGIRAESEVGRGTIMTVELPLESPAIATPTASEDGGPDRVPTPSVGGPQEPDAIARMYSAAERSGGLVLDAGAVGIEGEIQGAGDVSILVVDDEPDMRRYLVSTLVERYRVIQAGDGPSACALAQAHRPSAILLDVMLPGEDGISVCRRLRDLPGLQDTKIVMLTARPDEETRISCLDAGADDFMTKPFSLIELRTRIANLLRTHQLQRELRERAVEIQAAMDRLRATEGQLVQSEKVRALGDMAAGVLHEIGNPLNYAMTALDLAVLDAPDDLDEETRTSITDALEGLRRIKAIIADLKAFAYPSDPTAAAPSSLRRLVDSAARLTGGELEGIELAIGVPDGLQVTGSPDQLLHLLMNLITNAAKAIHERDEEAPPGRISIDATEDGDGIRLEISDNGPGIPDEIIDRIFDPFFTTREVQEGMGLGLSLCRTIAEHHGGTLTAASRPGAGATFTLSLNATITEPSA